MARKIMIIRHAEKPDAQTAGVSMEGNQDVEELTVRGWQRSGALVGFFASGPLANSGLASPQFIFASGTAPHSKSLRPQHTVAALAEKLGQPMNLAHIKGDEVALVAEVLAKSEPVLIAWQHEAIPGIVNRLVGNSVTCPQQWPAERFDLVWLLDQPTPTDDWAFAQLPQMLLPGDNGAIIPF